jgi:hypothetical protein
MNNEITPEQQKQIADILDKAEADGLLEQAMSTKLSADEQERFMQIMQDRMDQLYAEAATKQGYADLGVSDLKKKLSKDFCEKFCDGTQLNEKYRLKLELGSSEERELVKDVMQVFVLILVPLYPNVAYLIALYMTLYIVRVQLDKRCAKLCH